MIGKIIDYGNGWNKVLAEGRIFYIATDTEKIRMGQDFEFNPDAGPNKVIEVRT